MNNRIALSLKHDSTPGRWRWSFSGDRFALAGSSAARDRDDAVLCALAEGHRRLVARGAVEVVVSLHDSSPIWGIAGDIADHFPRVRLVPFTANDAAIRDAAMAALVPQAPAAKTAFPARLLAPITVATDGSSAHGRIGWGWLAEDGSHDCDSARITTRQCDRRTTALVAELRAISAALESLPGRRLHIRTDCRHAISLVTDWIGGSDRMPVGYLATHHTATAKGGLRWIQEQVRREAGRIDISWVRGHAGDPLNEGADSLAKLARRAAEGTWGVTPSDVPDRAASIAQVFATQNRQLATAA